MLNTTFIRRTRFTAAALIGAAALAITASPTALAGPTGTPNALEVIAMLERQGDTVIVSRTGNKPLQMCTVTSVREIQAQYWWTRPRVQNPKPTRRPNAVGTQLIIRTMRVEIRC
ncbi:hypothetical protein [Mycobacteroides abscessus]|uniref:Ig-like domain-containing protein n=5 Tax=Mycobacteroides abscessus TaxID=36809 RepID=B1MMD8_MYCA9|nr:hypothetical protein [Mycobacteroides abscessus]EUA63643.1 hypothetical protein I542_3800 [Mycobacteroides abscessus 1948]ALM18970.1 hypothetical protein AOY11_24490 [Mycobacteroides abscessus]AMU48033.1 hypothetical protein A3O00_24355 [Mycobacteroides abscessus]AMU53072.1 hypothetical protein A3O01_25070 [Mycobacteroides abscessus]AMU58027.1 hypothetical protein A3O02_24705 [Mycobacteroides abscessus]